MKHLPDIILFSGATALSYGSWLVYQPSGFIVAGILLIVGGTIMAKAA